MIKSYFNLERAFFYSMEMRISGSALNNFEVSAPPSKSYTHRAYTIATLANGVSTIHNPLRAGDTDSTLSVCKSFGAEVIEEPDRVKITGTNGVEITPVEDVFVGNSGTTIRLFTSIAALTKEGVRTVLFGDESVNQRPMQPLLDALSQLGIVAVSEEENGTPPIIVHGGGIDGGKTEIRGDISSQFISSLLIASPFAKNHVTISLTTQLKSRPYVDITIDIMKAFGVNVDNHAYRHLTAKKNTYTAGEYRVEGDYSSASYFFALAALTGVRGRVKNLNQDSVQGDRIILEILKKMGVNIKEDENSVTVEGGSLKGAEIDLGDTPDMLPTITALACGAEGKTAIKNIKHARYKESDRVSVCAQEFSKFGVLIEEGDDYLIVEGAKNLSGAKVNSHNDHRIVMALSVLAVVAEGKTIIDNSESVSISYPGFFDDLKRVGVRLE